MVKKVRIKYPGSLEKYGYRVNESQKRRRMALRRADRAYGTGKVDQKLAALNRFNSHHPPNRQRVRSDLRHNERRNPRGREEIAWVDGHYRSDGTWVRGHDRIVRKERQIFI